MSNLENEKQRIQELKFLKENFFFKDNTINNSTNKAYLIPFKILNFLTSDEFINSMNDTSLKSISLKINKPFYLFKRITCYLCRENIDDIPNDEFYSCCFCCKDFHKECYDKLLFEKNQKGKVKYIIYIYFNSRIQ